MSVDLLKDAIQLIRTGQKQEAREILVSLLQANPKLEAAWIWLVETANSDAERLSILRSCLNHNPDSALAARALQAIGSRQSTPQTPQPSSAESHDDTTAQLDEIAGMLGMKAGSPAPSPASNPPNLPAQRSETTPIPALDGRDLSQTPGRPSQERKRSRPRPLLTALFILLAFIVVAAVVYLLVIDNPFAAEAPTLTPRPTSIPPTATQPPTSTPENLPTNTPRPTWTPYATATWTLTPTITPTPSNTPTITPLTFDTLPAFREVMSADNLSQIENLGNLGSGAVYASLVNWIAKVQLNEVVVWDASNNNEIGRFKLEYGISTGLAISENGRWVASSNTTFLVQIWNLQTGQLTHSCGTGNAISVPPDSSAQLKFSPDENYLAVSNKGILSVWDMRNTNRPVAYFAAPPEILQELSQGENLPPYFSVDFSLNSQFLVASGFRVIIIVDLVKQEKIVINTSEVFQHRVKFSPDNKWIAAAGPGYVALIDPISGLEMQRLKGVLVMDQQPTPFTFSPDSGDILILHTGECCGQTIINRYRISDGTLINSSNPYDIPPSTIEFSPNGDILLVEFPANNEVILSAGEIEKRLTGFEFTAFIPDQTGIVGLIDDIPVVFGIIP